MPSTTFTAGDREYSLSLNFALARRIRDDFGVDLVDVSDGKAFERLAASYELTIDVLWAMVERQAEKRHSINRDDFEESLDGDAMDAAGDALVEAVVSFSRPALRPALRKLVELSEQATEKAATMAVDRAKGQVDEAIAAKVGPLPKAPRRTRGGSGSSSRPKRAA